MLPIFLDNSELYFMVVNQADMGVASYNCDIRGLNNMHRFLSQLEDDVDNVIILANWKGQYQSHTFLCDKFELMVMVRFALGDNFSDELCSGLSY